MDNRCNICIEESCGGTKDCNCKECKKRECCNKVLHPTIRITTKCTQSCQHCCFSCSPKKSDMINIKTAKDIAMFMKNNNIKSANIMGGEFFMNPDWYIILTILVKDLDVVRLVSNGDWAENEEETNKLLLFLEINKNVMISISKDVWHNNINVDKAEKICLENDILFNVAKEDQMVDDSIVPMGKGQFHYGFYSSFGCYCQNPAHKYSFLIDEIGEIYKCSFGVWNYDNIKAFINGGFDERFKYFNKVFYSCFLGNCSVCLRGYARQTEKEKSK